MNTVCTPLAAVPPIAPAERVLTDGFDASAATVAAAVDSHGLACLRDVVPHDWLTAARDFVTHSVELNGAQELLVEDFAARPGTFAHQLVSDERVEPFMRQVATACRAGVGFGDGAIESELRLVNGPPRSAKPLWFHYDSTAITLVIPILIPTSTPGRSGELVLYPNRRPFRRRVVTNILEKCLSQNDFYRRWFVRYPGRRSDVRTEALEPGNAYVFSGYRSYHATLPSPPGSLRATLILHFGDVHDNSRLLNSIRGVERTIRRSIRTRRSSPTVAVQSSKCAWLAD
ncbi:hypothetical protein H7K45_29055 [Mycobacterium yunnanensis]|uniref:Phytanoyl-CoA dioxygenase (PhyH) n=1 Tax=Mycobacterium yunnanensis TaxID=368477 RepID=A0A9X3C4L6_9MYCO|nr:hypothetical protein [Mycobacterium yunnanensis]MCV7424596.1 hypothetical protein [Mycobacterium yunnanensis]